MIPPTQIFSCDTIDIPLVVRIRKQQKLCMFYEGYKRAFCLHRPLCRLDPVSIVRTTFSQEQH